MVADLEGSASHSFWIGASYLLAMCIAQPIFSKLSSILACRGVVLSSIVLLAVGSTVCERATTLLLILVGRTVQGLGAGGLTILPYALYDHLEGLAPESGMRFVSAIAVSSAVGTVCGPLVGAISDGDQDWVTVP